MTKKSIGRQVLNAMKAKKWTIYRLWKASGVKSDPISAILKGKTNYTIESLLKVCEALEIDCLGNVKEQEK